MPEEPVLNTSLASPRIPLDPRLLRGLSVGLVAASIGALYTVFARWGIGHGMDSSDMTFLRFAVAGVVTLPVLAVALRRDARAFLSRWRAWLAVSLLAGPLFGLLMFTALQWAPASHAAVFPFTAMSVMGTLMSVAFLGDRLTLRKVVGIGIVVTGLLILSGLDVRTLSGKALLGDALFIAAGTLYTYSKMVALLGPARAAVFPALAPGIAALLAWPVLNHVPTGVEATGLVVSVVGLLITVTAGLRAGSK